jgi:Asp-tRNA(Asn)/Glu-tRNA(Gln) amidotransferase A subunit family amidase
VADLRLMLQVMCGRDGHDPEGPPVPWRQAEPWS